MEVNAALAWLLLLVNDERMLEVVRLITGCGPIGHFDGRVYRMEPSTDHYDSWHDDLGEGRLVALSVNLGREPYEGGALEVRDRRTGASAEVRSARTGDALLFAAGRAPRAPRAPGDRRVCANRVRRLVQGRPELPLCAALGRGAHGFGRS